MRICVDKFVYTYVVYMHSHTYTHMYTFMLCGLRTRNQTYTNTEIQRRYTNTCIKSTNRIHKSSTRVSTISIYKFIVINTLRKIFTIPPACTSPPAWISSLSASWLCMTTARKISDAPCLRCCRAMGGSKAVNGCVCNKRACTCACICPYASTDMTCEYSYACTLCYTLHKLIWYIWYTHAKAFFKRPLSPLSPHIRNLIHGWAFYFVSAVFRFSQQWFASVARCLSTAWRPWKLFTNPSNIVPKSNRKFFFWAFSHFSLRVCNSRQKVHFEPPD